MSRRRLLAWGLGGGAAVLAAGASGVELVLHGVLPGRQRLVQATGGCHVEAPPGSFEPGATSTSGTFASQKRNQTVGYTIALPPGHVPGTALPLILVLHGFGRTHADALSRLSLAQAAALEPGAFAPHLPVALAAADGGNGYWHAHPGDDPLGMVVEELLPMCQRLGLGQPPEPVAALGISMGGYGVLHLAQAYPGLVSAVAAISPAVWTSYAQARAADPGAFDSAQDFAANDVIAHAPALAGTPVWIASGRDDPFHTGVVALEAALPRDVTVSITKGCHDDDFWRAAEPDALGFLTPHLLGHHTG